MWKKFTSISILFSSLIMLVSGIAVYFSPPSHISGFLGWEFLYLSKKSWMSLHVNSGLIFCVFFIFHTFFNIRFLKRYLYPQKIKFSKGFAPLIISTLLIFYMVAGSFYQLFPFDKVLKIGRGFKIKGVTAYGPLPPPYGKASSIPLKKLSFMLGTRPEKIVEIICKTGMKLPDSGLSLKEIASINNVSIGHILDLLNENLQDFNGDKFKKMEEK